MEQNFLVPLVVIILLSYNDICEQIGDLDMLMS